VVQQVVFMCLQRTPLNELIYVADNLAYFPYQQQDEPLFIMHHLDIIVSVSGSNLLQSYKEVCLFAASLLGYDSFSPVVIPVLRLVILGPVYSACITRNSAM